VIRNRLGRIATVITAGTLALMLVGVGGVAAKNPSWTISITKLPPTVGAGHEAGYTVVVTNLGPSNINTLSMLVTTPVTPGAAPTYFSGLAWNYGGPEIGCTGTGPGGSGPLACDLGTLSGSPSQSVTFTVAYHVPTGTTGSFDITVAIQSGSGNTGSDGGTSRGDAFSKSDSTGIGNSQNFDGGFSVTGDTYQTTGSLGRNNKQSTKLETTDTIIPVTITDGVTTYPCDSGDPQCSRLIGEWSVLNVNNTHNLYPIKVTLLIWGGAVPGGLSTSDIFLVHADGTGAETPVKTACDANPPTNADCLVSVTKVGNNYQIVAWLKHNGSIRGGF
jgi:hypothetical protein